ncbi:MAG: hypothetical protein ACREIF_08130 [Chthoniobacterales bacterium]
MSPHKPATGKIGKPVNYRKLAFSRYPPFCAHCGYGVPDVLEVAHVNENDGLPAERQPQPAHYAKQPCKSPEMPQTQHNQKRLM